ncbi:hypothetical protein [Novosphingobium sp.]|uniref:hypothetical protein n=1 Tax=Novosphingobium sp. TaxID=1874826 RepID=UPI003B52AC7F
MVVSMPPARPKSEPVAPAQLAKEEASFIADTVRQFYGEDAVLRNFGPDPKRLDIHVETDRDVGLAKYDCIGILMTRIDRQIGLEVTRRGTRVAGSAKLAYRNGEIF